LSMIFSENRLPLFRIMLPGVSTDARGKTLNTIQG